MMLKMAIKMNVEKTQLVFIKMELKMFGQTITEQTELKLLGVTFDKRMSLKNHCGNKVKQGSQRVNLLRVISGRKWGANAKTLLKLYKQYIRPVLETGCVATCNVSQANLQTLQRIQNSALRTALRGNMRSRITEIHEMARIEPLADRLKSLCSRATVRFRDSENMKHLETLPS